VHLDASATTSSVITIDGFRRLIATLRADGFTTVGPRQREGSIGLAPFDDPGELAWGWRDQQEGGLYRLEATPDATLEGFTVGPDSWKRYLYPPRLELLSARMTDSAIELLETVESTPRYALIGVRPCDLAAIEILDRVLNTPPFVDPVYVERRQAALIVTMNCVRAGATCFCTSQGTGPRARGASDLALTELDFAAETRYLAEAGSERGRALLDQLPSAPATPADLALADRRTSEAARQMGRFLENERLPEILTASLDSPIWDEIATRCFNCKNCTLVCPTCFCVSIIDTTSLDGSTATRTRLWDTCHSLGFTYTHGGPTRSTPAARYRQWLTHKFAGWVDQFEVSGCVGCGRCITWCPVGIDVTVEAARLRTAAAGGVLR